MRCIMRRICLFLVMIAVIVFTGCGQKKKEDIHEIWAASKAFLYRYSRGLRREVLRRL